MLSLELFFKNWKDSSPMSSNSVVISIQNVSKIFRKHHQHTLKELLPAFFGGKKTVDVFWALRDVSLQVKKGETLGILGSNGSGKSTLLKLIAGVSSPTEGKVRVTGRIAPLIELGAGFHPELSGRENVYLNGVILGMKRKEIDAKFDQIVEFAELKEFIDAPVKHYSSGMYLRLAFSVAVHTDPDILLVDEILAVGDKKFRNKCFAKWEELKQKGVTSLLVSHDVKQLQQFCDRAVFLQKGKLEEMQSVNAAIDRYDAKE